MHVRNARLATLALATAFFAAACGGKTDAPAATAGTEGAAATGEGAQKISAEITGAGASFIYPLMARWSTDYNTATGAKINYQSIGSGGGIAQIKAATVDFGSSDKPLSPEELAQAGLGQFPSVIGGVVPVINVEGLQPGQLKLNGTVLADIFLHKITTWNDPAIASDNPGASLPSSPIVTVVRSDGSGTTSNFTKYLKAASPSIGIEPGDAPKWPEGTQTANGNAGVAQSVKSTAGAIGYVDYSDAKATGLTFASIKNKAGNYVAASLEGASAALEGAKINPDLTYNALNAEGAQAYPITAGTWIIVYQKQPNAQTGNNLKGYLNYILTEGQGFAADVDIAKLPSGLDQQAIAQLSKLQIG